MKFQRTKKLIFANPNSVVVPQQAIVLKTTPVFENALVVQGTMENKSKRY